MLVFTKTTGFRHASIPAAIQAVRDLGAKNGFDVDATEDGGLFTATGLAPYDAVVFLLTTGDVLDDRQQAAFEAYIRAGHGYLGVHSAADTEREWPWYGHLVGAWSSGHPEIQTATLNVASPRDPSTAALPARWTREDEWYGFLTSPRANGVSVLLSLDESSYAPGEWTMGTDHPVAWKHAFGGGRAFYTELGHTEQSYAEPLFLGHLLGGIRYALGQEAAAPRIDSLTLTVHGRRVTVVLRHESCPRCAGVLRIRGRTVKLRVAGGVAAGTTKAIPRGRWQATIELTDRATGLTRTARRFVRIS